MANLNHEEREKKWQTYWDKNQIFKTKNSKKVFSIDTPPPTVSGKMHIGHAFSYSQEDFIARFMRMYKGNVFYPFGTDDNGLPTERLVEKLTNVKSVNLSRAEFIKLCLKTLKEVSPEFVEDWKRLGISADFSKIYSTIDLKSQKISQNSFLELYEKGHIYKKSFPTIWCPECQTSIAQAELEDQELDSKFFTLKFEVEAKEFLIATTRPELLYACVAIFVNPKDKRYEGLVGKKAKVPLFGFEVPIISDNSAQIEKGTGALMVCTYGDKYDVEAVGKYKLNPKKVIGKNGSVNIPGYEGLNIKTARKKIIEDLENKNLIYEQRNITHSVNVHDKCGTEIEFIDSPQWFIKILDKKKELLSQGNKIKWYPEFMKKRYEHWINGLEWDWSISRNRHFGIPIPIWECEKCNKIILPNKNELPVDPLEIKKKCPGCKENAVPEKMVLDTWATSSVTPQIANNLFGGKFGIPFSLRPQAHDIIRTWAFYTIVKAFLNEGKIPWKEIVISGNVSLKGEKMSKSKGNIIEPKKVINEYGADALRFWAAGSKLGHDLDYQEKDLVTGKKFVTKIMNASNFVFMNLKDYDGKKKPKKLEPLDKLFLSKLEGVIKNVTKYFESYDYSTAKQEIEQFFWTFCDNYLEIVKKRVYQGDGEKKISAQYTLYKILFAILKLIAPIAPFVTEEIYQENFKKFEKDKSIHISRWPKHNSVLKKTDELDTFFEILSKIRQEKTNSKKAMNSEIILTLEKNYFKIFKGMLDDLKNVTNSKEIKEGKEFRVEFL
ncbi:valine--tRNA ligase [Candidatus Pacearchaeota archaeon CG10_big_fil_rev_8_21_14_0_10_32_42]|nr:MAG: valine--tRNA ligase [Candidatus Pacearchaeota archaeon CG10_big_fil_rev_8_21_14_0_10_32_42]